VEGSVILVEHYVPIVNYFKRETQKGIFLRTLSKEEISGLKKSAKEVYIPQEFLFYYRLYRGFDPLEYGARPLRIEDLPNLPRAKVDGPSGSS
jgi:hypothetical protein